MILSGFEPSEIFTIVCKCCIHYIKLLNITMIQQFYNLTFVIKSLFSHNQLIYIGDKCVVKMIMTFLHRAMFGMTCLLIPSQCMLPEMSQSLSLAFNNLQYLMLT